MRKIIKWIMSIIIVIFVIHVIFIILFGRVSYKETIATKYSKSDTCQIISTKHFEIVTPPDWIHIFHCYGEEGEAVGSFLTKHGKVRYEYGIFSNPFEVDSIYVFSRDSFIANRFTIYIGRDETTETGIHIPPQHEMEWPFSFFMNQACTDNLDELIQGIKQMKFKEYLNLK